MGAGARQTVRLDAGTWASAVASVTAGGETASSFRAAERLHARGAEATDGADRHPAIAAILRYFAWEHLPPKLQEVSRPFGELAERMADTLPSGPELTAGLRKLLEAKDCAVRAALDLP
jgi:hypothetical protein